MNPMPLPPRQRGPKRTKKQNNNIKTLTMSSMLADTPFWTLILSRNLIPQHVFTFKTVFLLVTTQKQLNGT